MFRADRGLGEVDGMSIALVGSGLRKCRQTVHTLSTTCLQKSSRYFNESDRSIESGSLSP
ncbi:hypothetical protein [Nostoc sp. ChiVER01]|uniref:hypothetical protein n=1 Tax=Nostoc sp. ChiVER01 TaxID=3075382 RepID=UPI002AD21952|nr:hypothetical protein [Nostoc sp. ChiVER01]MDZ8227345.1 hypothetical protein [Nostoc sp. ChiVER01]